MCKRLQITIRPAVVASPAGVERMDAWVRRGGAVTRHSRLNEGAPPYAAPGLARFVLGVDTILRVPPVRQGPPSRHQPAAYVDPVGREDLGHQAAVPVPLDHLAAHLYPRLSAPRGRPTTSCRTLSAGPATRTSGPVRARRCRPA